jgi:hypothetical protein
VGLAEYFYGLTPNNITFDGVPNLVISEVHLTQFISDTAQQKAFSSIEYYTTDRTGASPPINSTQVGLWRFDKDGRILEFDLWNPLYSEVTRAVVAGQALLSDPAFKDALINITCDRHERFCTQNASHVQYSSVAACQEFLKGRRMGEPDVFSADNVLCRNQHATLTQLRPEVHCPHVGPSGGGFCVDTPYTDYFQKPMESFKNDPNRLIAPEQFVTVLK